MVISTQAAFHMFVDLLGQFAQAVAGGGVDFDGELLAGAVAADAVGARAPAGLARGGRGRGWGRRGSAAGPWRSQGSRRFTQLSATGCMPSKQAVDQGLAVDGDEQGAADADVGQDRVLDLEVDVLVGEAGLEDVFELVGVGLPAAR
jgi:hypothetical protein